MAAPIDNLTDKQRRFCEEYVIDWNGARAARAAGYSENTAEVIASENLRKPNIQAYISEIQKDLAKLCGISAAMVANEYKKIAFNSAASLRRDWDNVKDWNELTEEEKAIISEVETITTNRMTDDGALLIEKKLKFKTYDKQRALAELKKMLGFDAPEKHEHKVKTTLSYSDLTEDEIKERLERINNRP